MTGSTGGGGIIIIGDEQIATVEKHINLVNPLMQPHLKAIIASYKLNPTVVTVTDRLFFANCEAQIAFLI